MIHNNSLLKRIGIAAALVLLLMTGIIAPNVVSQEGATVVTVADLEAGTGGVEVDSDGNIIVADIGLARAWRGTTLYKITPEGEASVLVSEQGLLGPTGNAFDSMGNLFQASLTGNRVHKITPEGEVSQFAVEGITGPVGVAVDKADNVYVANCRSASIQKITPEGVSTRFVNSNLFACANGIALDDDDNVYVANFSNGRVIKVTQEGEASVFATVPNSRNLGHLIYAGDGVFYVVSRGTHQVFKMNLDGELTLLAGSGERGHDDGPALEATFSLPNDIGISPDGKILYLNEMESLIGTVNKPSVLRAIHLPVSSE
jgi:sugar lactone lactonase YvrE